MPEDEQQRLSQFSSDTRDDTKGAVPGSEQGDEEERLFMASLLEGERVFLEGHKGLGNSQKAEVAWLERRYRETGDPGYLYVERDVRDFITGAAPTLQCARE
jgi:hypothetical protein